MISHQSNLHRWTAEVTGLVSTQSHLTRFGTILLPKRCYQQSSVACRRVTVLAIGKKIVL